MELQINRKSLEHLSIPEQIQLVEDIWDNISQKEHMVQLTDAQKTTLDERLDAYDANPKNSSSWEDVKQRIIRANQ